MLAFVLWYIAITLIGWLAWPLAYSRLPRLADRGYAVSRALGWLVWGFIFWLLSSLGILHNDAASLLLSAALLAGLSLWSLARSEPGAGSLGERLKALRAWISEQRGWVLAVEMLFLLAFAGYSFVRAANPEATGTEKPMELAFINAILRSPGMPPHDPWLSGYAISYYHFGYILVAMLAKITGTSGSVAFNLGLGLVFGLAAIGSFGLLYNLLAAYRRHSGEGEAASDAATKREGALAPALLGPLFLLLVGNFEAILHVLHSGGVGWTRQASGQLASPFWKWLDILDLNTPPAEPFSWDPTHYWWWWRASRVISDYDMAGRWREIIDEFPAFSFVLGDLHPHVLAMPFAFLAMSLALNLALGGGGKPWVIRLRYRMRGLFWAALLAELGGIALALVSLSAGLGRLGLVGLLAAVLGGMGLLRLGPAFNDYGLRNIAIEGAGEEQEIGWTWRLDWPTLLLAALLVGASAFLNLWDLPVTLLLLAGSYTLWRVQQTGWQPGLIGEAIALGALLGMGGLLLYLPFFLGFASQAGGILPNLVFITRGAHLWVMFGPLLLPILALLVFVLIRQGVGRQFWRGLLLAGGVVLGLWLLNLLVSSAIASLASVTQSGLSEAILSGLGAPSYGALLQEGLRRRLLYLGGWGSVLAVLGLALGLLFQLYDKVSGAKVPSAPVISEHLTQEHSTPEHLTPAHLTQEHGVTPPLAFVLLLIGTGALLVLGVEFFYLRDQFGSRMNTIFKFYFQTWQVWSVAAAFASAVLIKEARSCLGSAIAFIGLVAILGVGLVYPLFGFWSKTDGFHYKALLRDDLSPADVYTLDATAYLKAQSPNEAAAIDWLKTAPVGVLAEAVGGSYSSFARVSTLSGMPTVLGWPGHEGQWRGGYDEVGSRQPDIERLYCSRSWDEAAEVINRYHIRYIFVGPQERQAYQPNGGSCPTGLNEGKFQRFLQPVFQQGDVTIFESPVLTP